MFPPPPPPLPFSLLRHIICSSLFFCLQLGPRNVHLLQHSRCGCINSKPFTLSLCDVLPNLPHDPATTPYCIWWVDNDSTISCTDFLATRNITIDNFVRWNPFVTSACGNFGQWTSYCVEAFNEPDLSTTWTDLGCWIDSGKPYALLNAGIASLKLSRDVCKTYCRSQGYLYAGVEGAQVS